MPREHDPMLDTLERVQAEMCSRIQRVATGEERMRALDAVRAQLRALAAAEEKILYPAFSKVSLRTETRCLLDDIRDHRAVQLAGVDELARTKRAHLRKLRGLQLCDLIARDAATHATRLIAVLRCQLPRALYGALGRAFAAHVAELAAPGATEAVTAGRTATRAVRQAG